MKVAYLTGEYPKTSHSFIRREIAGIEEAGLEVERISVRRAGELVDEADLAECARTRVLLDRGPLGLLPGTVAVMISRPLRMLRAVYMALVMGWRSPRGIFRHLAYVAEACVLLRFTSRFRIDHVHAHFATNPADVALLCRELGGPPFSFTAHGTADLGSAAVLSLPLKIERASFAVAVCEDGRRRLLQWTPKGHETKVFVVRCGVDQTFLAGEIPRIPAAPRLLCVARLSPEKGCSVLLRAAGLLLAAGVDFTLSLVGDGPEREELEHLVRDLSLDGRVRFEGWQSGLEVREHVLGSRGLVLASHSEGLPVVIMEAFALRRPVIATDVGGISELVVPGESGWLVPAGSEPALAAAMREALSCPSSDLDEMGRHGAELVAKNHDAGLQARALARLFLRSGAG